MQNTTTGPNPTDVKIAVGAAAFFRGAARRAAELGTARPVDVETTEQIAARRDQMIRAAAKLAVVADAAWQALEDTDTDSPDYPAKLADVRAAENRYRAMLGAADEIRP